MNEFEDDLEQDKGMQKNVNLYRNEKVISGMTKKELKKFKKNLKGERKLAKIKDLVKL